MQAQDFMTLRHSNKKSQKKIEIARPVKFYENLARPIVLFTNYGSIVVFTKEIPSKENCFTIAKNYLLLENTVIGYCCPIP